MFIKNKLETRKKQASQREKRQQTRAHISKETNLGASNNNSDDPKQNSDEKEHQFNSLVLKAAELEKQVQKALEKLKVSEKSNALLTDELNKLKNKALTQPKISELDGQLKSIKTFSRIQNQFLAQLVEQNHRLE